MKFLTKQDVKDSAVSGAVFGLGIACAIIVIDRLIRGR